MPWLDSLRLLVGMYGDGLDVQSYVQTLSVFRDVPADDVDAGLALLGGIFLAATIEPEIPGSPLLKTHRTWYAHATTAWLADRRGWSN